jgi:hypothetical protein
VCLLFTEIGSVRQQGEVELVGGDEGGLSLMCCWECVWCATEITLGIKMSLTGEG